MQKYMFGAITAGVLISFFSTEANARPLVDPSDVFTSKLALQGVCPDQANQAAAMELLPLALPEAVRRVVRRPSRVPRHSPYSSRLPVSRRSPVSSPRPAGLAPVR